MYITRLFFKLILIQNYKRYSYIVICCQVAFLMLFSNLKRMGRKNPFWAELGRNPKIIFLKNVIFGILLYSKSHFGPSPIDLKTSPKFKNRFSGSFWNFHPPESFSIWAIVGPKSTPEVQRPSKIIRNMWKWPPKRAFWLQWMPKKTHDFGPT